MKDLAYPYLEIKNEEQKPLISLDEIKAYLKLNQFNDANDLELNLMYETALDYAQKYSRQYFQRTKFSTKRCFWGELRNGEFNPYFTLRRSPLVSIESIKYDDENVLHSSDYTIVTKFGNYGQVILNDNLPELKTEWFPIEIVFEVGYEKLPSDVKLAILQHIASMWINRGDCDNDTYNKCPKISKDIYKKYKIMEVGA